MGGRFEYVRKSQSLRRIAGATSVTFIGTFATSFITFLTQVLLARTLNLESVGRLAALAVIINLLTPVGSAGVNWFVLRAIGQEGWGARRWLESCKALVCGCIVLSALILIAYVVETNPPDHRDLVFVAVFALPILLGQIMVELAVSRLQLEGRFADLAMFQAATQSGRFTVSLLLVVTFLSMETVLIGYAVVGTLMTIWGVILIRGFWDPNPRIYGPRKSAPDVPVHVSGDTPSLMTTARGASPFIMMTLFSGIYFQGPVVVLEWMRGDALAGVYNSAFLITAAFSMFPNVIYVKLLTPTICRWTDHDRESLSSIFHVGVPGMILLGLLCMTSIMVGATTLVPLLFGLRYIACIPALLILSLTLPIRFAQAPYSSLFISHSNVVRKVRYLGASGLIMVIGCLILIPLFGMEGAAVATVVAELFALVAHIQGTARFVDGVSVTDTLRPEVVMQGLRHLTKPQRSLSETE